MQGRPNEACYPRLVVSLLAAVLSLQNLASALVLAAFLSLGARAWLLEVVAARAAAAGPQVPARPPRRRLVTALRLSTGAVFFGLGLLYLAFAAHQLEWDGRSVSVALATAAAVMTDVAVAAVTKRLPERPGLTRALVQLCLLLALLLLAALTLMRAGFLALTTDRPVLLVDVTGETLDKPVRWAPPDQEAREQVLAAHHVVFRTPEGVSVAEAWVYGDQVAVKGRVLRLSPYLNAAGVSNLFELLFAHNGYLTAERHQTMPHLAVPLPPLGPLAVHPWWRPLQRRLLELWEQGSAEGSAWAVRSATIESTYFPLVDVQGRPARQVFRVVLTPGGLTSS